jgi:nucleoside-diphosphate-sugar epimerase
VGEDRLHVVFGTGQVGRALATHLARQGLAVRAVSRHQPPALDGGVEWRPADVTDPEAAEVGHPVAIRSVPKLALRALGLVNPMMRELAEMAYQFDEPFILHTSKYESAFGAAGTPLADAVAATVAWYRSRTTA